MVNGREEQCIGVYLRSSLLLTHVNRNTLLVSSETTEPWARTIYVQFAPHAKGVAGQRGFNFDDFSTKVPARHVEQTRSATS